MSFKIAFLTKCLPQCLQRTLECLPVHRCSIGSKEHRLINTLFGNCFVVVFSHLCVLLNRLNADSMILEGIMASVFCNFPQFLYSTKCTLTQVLSICQLFKVAFCLRIPINAIEAAGPHIISRWRRVLLPEVSS